MVTKPTFIRAERLREKDFPVFRTPALTMEPEENVLETFPQYISGILWSHTFILLPRPPPAASVQLTPNLSALALVTLKARSAGGFSARVSRQRSYTGMVKKAALGSVIQRLGCH